MPQDDAKYVLAGETLVIDPEAGVEERLKLVQVIQLAADSIEVRLYSL